MNFVAKFCEIKYSIRLLFNERQQHYSSIRSLSVSIKDMHCRLKESFLCAAAKGGRIEECASLLDLGAEIDWPHLSTNDDCHDANSNNDNDTPLLAAVRNGHSDVAALLLAHGADPLRCSANGDTVLHLAAACGDESMASLFAPNATELVTLTNRDGMTAYDVAVTHGYASFAEFLIDLCDETVENMDHSIINAANHESSGGISAASLSSNGSNSHSESDSGVQSSHVTDTNSLELRSIASPLNDHADSDSGLESVSSHVIETDVGETGYVATASTMSDHYSSESTSDIDETLHYSHRDEHEIDRNPNNLGDEDAENDFEETSRQLQQMRQLAHTQSIELYQAKFALNEALQEQDTLEKKLEDMKLMYGHDDDTNLGNKSLAELTAMEEKLRKSLDRITKTKEIVTNSLEEERTCVICRENPKTVLLMTCRHLCVCSECGQREGLDRCPLCREIITERINVFQ